MANALIVHPGTVFLSPERAKRAAQCINVWGYRQNISGIRSKIRLRAWQSMPRSMISR